MSLKKLAPQVAIAFAILFACDLPIASAMEEDAAVVAELDSFWEEVSRCVQMGDFQGYAATCHKQGVLVSGVKENSQPLSEALKRWKPGIEDTRTGKMKADVQFRFTRRLISKTTAHETGIFRYTSQPQGSEEKVEYVHFEALLIKQGNKWRTMMEFQKSEATLEQWQAIKPRREKPDIR